MTWLWETEFWAISAITGEIERYRGLFIEAQNIQQAYMYARRMGLDYIELTGNSFRDFDHVRMDEEFYKRLVEEELRNMSFDEFLDWLELATTRKDLESARAELSKSEDFTEHVKVIDFQLKKYDEENNEKKDQKGDKKDDLDGQIQGEQDDI